MTVLLRKINALVKFKICKQNNDNANRGRYGFHIHCTNVHRGEFPDNYHVMRGKGSASVPSTHALFYHVLICLCQYHFCILPRFGKI